MAIEIEFKVAEEEARKRAEKNGVGEVTDDGNYRRKEQLPKGETYVDEDGKPSRVSIQKAIMIKAERDPNARIVSISL